MNKLRRTVVAFGKLQARQQRLGAARDRAHGLQVLSIEQLAARLAGGFFQPVDAEPLRLALQSALLETHLGELDGIKALPGMVDAAFETLNKAWASGVDLTGSHPRLESIRALENAVLKRLPGATLRPCDLVARAIDRVRYAPALVGDVTVYGMTELQYCWRPLLVALSDFVKVTWAAGPRDVPTWVKDGNVVVQTSAAESPEVAVESCSTPLHEAVEALRWARELLATGVARPEEIAIAAVSTSDYDDYFLAFKGESCVDLHFVHGTKLTASRDGQTVSALADIVLRGLSQRRLRRLVNLIKGSEGPVSELPEGWLRVLPADAPLTSKTSWDKLLAQLGVADWPDGHDHKRELTDIVRLLQQGVAGAAEMGETLLRQRPLRIWRKALASGSAASLEMTLQSMREDDSLEGCTNVVWTPASCLAAAPRRFVRLLGLNSSRWPRRQSEDRLIPDHVISRQDLDPLPFNQADRTDFRTILLTTRSKVVLSLARRDGDGRLLGRSGLLQGMPPERRLNRRRVPEHALSNADRLLARPDEFASTAFGTSSLACWKDWWSTEVTAHDGLVAEDHGLVTAALARVQSASSLSLLLRHPLGFIWRYGLGIRAGRAADESLLLNALDFGNLVHEVLDAALKSLAVDFDGNDIDAALDAACSKTASEWEAAHAVPPLSLWKALLKDVKDLCCYALQSTAKAEGRWKSFGEVAFGGAKPKSDQEQPWSHEEPVPIPNTAFRIGGYIDRLDLSADGKQALVFDYKTGKVPKDEVVLNGGRELQRCLYSFAVKQLLGHDVSVAASLLYLRQQVKIPLYRGDDVLTELQEYLLSAHANLKEGRALPGTGAADKYDDLVFALPSNADGVYLKRKRATIEERLGHATQVWEAK